MRIVIDMQGAQNGSRFRGIGRYTIALTEAILRIGTEHDIVLVFNGLFPDSISYIKSVFSSKIALDKFKIWTPPPPVSFLGSKNLWRRQTAELLREAFLQSLNPDVLLISSLFEGAGDDVVTSVGNKDAHYLVATILYDLIPYLNQKTYLADEVVHQWYMEKLEHLKKSDLLFAISSSSRNEAIENILIDPLKIFNISAAIDSKFYLSEAEGVNVASVLKKNKITTPFLMFSSASDPRKNHLRLIEAYSKLSNDLRKRHQLVLAGGMAQADEYKFRNHAKKLGLSNKEVIFTGYLEDYEMVALYKACICFVFPSWHEGFGLPILEAMWCDAPVIGSNTSSIPEVIGYPQALFDPFSVDSIQEKIDEVLRDRQFRIALIEHGRLQRLKFSWDQCAKTLLKVLEDRVTVGTKRALNQVDILNNLIGDIKSLPLKPDSNEEFMSLAVAIDSSIYLKTLYIDISEIVQRDSKTGIQRVVRSILNAFLESNFDDYQVRFVCATANEVGYHNAGVYISKIWPNIDHGDSDEELNIRSGDILLVLDFQDVIAARQSSYYQNIRERGAKVYFVVYDLLPVLMPDFFKKEVSENFKKWLNVVATSDGAVCISQTVADQIKGWLSSHELVKNSSYRIGWFHLGADIDSSLPTMGLPDDCERILTAISKNISFLMVGTIEPRKGYQQVIDAFEILWANNSKISLVIVGKLGWMVEDVASKLKNHPQLNTHLFWLEGISDEYLEKIYHSSNCLIAASFGEGFGLPLIEAAKNNKPIIARDIPVFREVAADYAFYFSGTEPSQLANSILVWLDLYQKGLEPKSINMPRISWDTSKEQLVKFLGL